MPASTLRSPAPVSGEPIVGSAFRARSGYVRGETLELVPNERIVQRWRASDFPAGYPDARLEVTLVPESGGTKLCLSHQMLPRQNAAQYDEAWKERYWRPLRAYLAQRESG